MEQLVNAKRNFQARFVSMQDVIIIARMEAFLLSTLNSSHKNVLVIVSQERPEKDVSKRTALN